MILSSPGSYSKRIQNFHKVPTLLSDLISMGNKR